MDVRARRQTHSRGQSAAGFTLVELLLAAVLAGVVLSGAWGWLWNLAHLSVRTDNRAQAATAAAAAARAVAHDVALATAVLPPEGERDPACCLQLRHHHVAASVEDVVIAWDARRGVLWRNAPGTYLSDHVVEFSVSYVTASGEELGGAELGPSGWSDVRLVRIELEVEVGGEMAHKGIAIALAGA